MKYDNLHDIPDSCKIKAYDAICNELRTWWMLNDFGKQHQSRRIVDQVENIIERSQERRGKQ